MYFYEVYIYNELIDCEAGSSLLSSDTKYTTIEFSDLVKSTQGKCNEKYDIQEVENMLINKHNFKKVFLTATQNLLDKEFYKRFDDEN